MPKINATRLAKMRSLSMEISMTTSTKYCATAIICTLIIAAAYMITNRYEAAPISDIITVTRDNWTGRTFYQLPDERANH